MGIYTLLSIITVVLALLYLVSYVWLWHTKKHEILCRTLQLVNAIVLMVIQIPTLVIRLSSGESYANTILLLSLWALNSILDAFLLGNKMGEVSSSLDVVIRIVDSSTEEVTEESEEI